MLSENSQTATENRETDGGPKSPMEMPAVLQNIRAIPVVAIVSFDRLARLSLRAKISAHLESLNRRLQDALNRLFIIVEDARMQLGGAKARRWVRIARQPSPTLWRPSPQRWEARELLSDADLYAAVRENSNPGPSRVDASEHP